MAPAGTQAQAAVKPRSSGKSKHDNDANPDMSLPGIGNYTFERTIGQGNFAKVKLAKHKLTAQEVAIKIIDKTPLDEKKLGKLHREVRIMKMLNHPNIVKLYEVIETKHTLFLVMEYVNGGELYDYLVAHGRMKEKDARAKFRQILSAVNYCHKKRVIHRDLKAENLLLDANLNIKIADFGFSNNYNPESQLDTFCGSPPYAAPELFQGRKYVGPEVDIWSLGVILYVLCTGCLPFDGKDLKEMREVVCRGRYKVPFYLSDSCEKLLRKFLVRDPTKRASLTIICDDIWINEGYTDSPVTDNIGPDPIQEPDDEILRFMTDKFSVPRDQILACLKENTYDDISAIYLLLIDQKQNGKWTPYQPGVSPMSPVQLQQGTATPVSKAPPMATIGEDGDPNNLRAPAAAYAPNAQANKDAPVERRERSATMGANVTARQRPQTWVANDSQVQKLMDEFGKQNLQGQGSGQKLDNKSLPASGTVENSSSSTNGSGSTRATRHLTSPPTSFSPQDALVEEGAHVQPTQAQPPARRGVMGAIRSIGRRFSESTSSANAAAAAAAVQQQQAGADGEDRPRVLRFTFNSNTTSSKNPDEIIREIINACQKNGVKYQLNGRFLVECSWYFKEVPLQKVDAKGTMDGERLQRALDEVMSGSSNNIATKDMKDVVRFDVEVCELPRLKNLHGLRFKRIGGPSAEYKEICGRILSNVEL